MVLPTFLGIGVPRAGTTWLHELLASHPDVYVPTRRKEIYFFDLHYRRGLAWYQKFFPIDGDAARFRAIGEITPFYFYGQDCPERIARAGVGKLVLMLRNPVDRAWSYYAHAIQYGMYSGSFEAFLARANARFPVVEHGHYSRYLRNYLQYFDRDQLLILIFETALADVPGTKRQIADFLDIAVDRFPPGAGEPVVNPSYVPKARWAHKVAYRLGRALRDRDLDWVVNTAKSLGVKRVFGAGAKLPPMTADTRERLRARFRPEIGELETMLGVSLDVWR
jgi:hypothetical protein